MVAPEEGEPELYGRPITTTEIVRDGKVIARDAAQPFMAALPQTTKSN